MRTLRKAWLTAALVRAFAATLLMTAGTALTQTAPSDAPPPPHVRIMRSELKIPMPEAGEAGLQAFLIRPTSPGRHPLVLMTHGSSYSKDENHDLGAGALQPQAVWFARRGWIVVIVVRRGYGSSGGVMEKAHIGCDQASYDVVAEENARDLNAAYDSVKSRSDIDPTTVIATGSSAGGFAALAFAAHAPAALKAVINFSGGWHSMFFSGTCTRSGLLPEFHALGAASSRIPMLWLYAKNDSLFGPKFVAQAHTAFTEGGGQAELPAIGYSGEDGHYLFSESQSIWAPLVEDFLARHDLPSKDLDPKSGSDEMKLPPGFPPEIQEAFAKWQKMGPYKAFAVGSEGQWSYSVGRKTPEIAAEEAIDGCGRATCRIIAHDGPASPKK